MPAVSYLLLLSALAPPDACAPCHAAEYRKQALSHHAQALRPIVQSPLFSLLGAKPRPAGTDPNVSYEPRTGEVLAASGEIVATLQWAFGAGAQGITPVGMVDGRYLEYRFSYYPRALRFAPTFGHPERAATREAALGIPQDSRTISMCFNCHSTGARPGPDLSSMTPGITCERCHGPGREHIAAAQARAPAETIRRSLVNPGRFPARAQIQMCGECHRLPDPAGDSPEPEIEDPVSVRFAPIGLLASRCFAAGKQLSCATCHDPHDNALPREAAWYTERCRTCHAPAVAAKSKCPRAKNGDCLGCHMRQASLGPYLKFTDHRIRVYR